MLSSDLTPQEHHSSIHALRLLPAPPPAAQPARALQERFWISRAIAHVIDTGIVMGFGFYFAKIVSVLLVAGWAREIQRTGKGFGALFMELQAYAEASVSAATLTGAAIFFLVAVPLVFGSSIGLSLLGLRFEKEEGGRADARSLLLRILVCLVCYATFGIALLVTLRGKTGQFWQDRLSGSRIVKA